MTKAVYLYENNAGHLFLLCGDVAYDVTPVDSTFADDAAQLGAGDTGQWTVDRVDATDVQANSGLVAEWSDGKARTWLEDEYLGVASRRYLGREDVKKSR